MKNSADLKKKLLFVAFHFPPYGGGSGVHRAAKAAQYLPENGWLPYILTAKADVYETVSNKVDRHLADAKVIRALALDTHKHLAYRGHYPRLLALPDRWSSWAIAAIPKGLLAIYRQRIDVILATFPIATAILIGLVLNVLSRKPLVVDLRDSMTEDEYPRDRLTRRVYRFIESSAVRRSCLLIFTAESTRRMYLNRYPDLAPDKCVVIPNGYDEDDFVDLVPSTAAIPPVSGRPIRLVHSGVLYTDDRDPRCFFRALSRLKAEGVFGSHNVKIDLRASGSEDYYRQLLRELGIDDFVHLLPALSHRDALRDIADADGLLLFQAASCNHQIPAKAYEYFRIGKPILALTDPSGDTAALVKAVGGSTLMNLGDENSIYQALPDFVRSVRDRTHLLPDSEKALKYTRRNGTAELGRHLDSILSLRPVSGTEAAGQTLLKDPNK